MKQILAILLTLTFVSCAEKPLDLASAQKVVEALIDKADKGDWEGIEDFYTAEFNASETVDVKVQKLIRLRDTLGPIKSKELISSTDVAEFGKPQQLVLKYRVAHASATTIETYTVQQDEGGYKIASQSVETESK